MLVIDDEAALRIFLRLTLEQEGYSVADASEATSALALAREHPPDLILLDLGMPITDGWAVLTALGDDQELRTVPVVVFTGDADESSEWRAKELGASAYMTKPVDPVDLVRFVARVLTGSRSGDGDPPA